MKRVLKNLPFDVCLIALCVGGFFMGNTIAYNLAVFSLWVLALLGVCLWSSTVTAALRPIHLAEGKRGRLFKAWDVFTDTVLVLLPVAAGMHFLGAVLFLGTVAKQQYSSTIDKEIEDGKRMSEG